MMGKMIGKGTYYNSKGEVEKDYRFDNGMLMSSKKAWSENMSVNNILPFIFFIIFDLMF